ncbi:hypothetical protein ABH14_04270 [Brevibacillus brevis]|uniref:hypothetical protein n=1 Tax=Brevibacillus brevis TaxID=1393 RepID=UPI001901E03F|nr:hypothetical protein [Brevibacillus brevis]MBH0329017.1 hypothetical protein [Brevibacillus brevis]
MKKSALIPAALLLAVLTACGNTQSTEQPTNQNQSTTGTQQPAGEATTQKPEEAKKEEQQVIAAPQEIVVYKQGEKTSLKPEDNKFKEILALMNKRFETPADQMRFDESTQAVEKDKKEALAVEFNYAEVTTNTLPATVHTDNKTEVKAKTLFFVLSGDNKNHMFDSEDGKTYGTAPLHLTESTELTELLNK